MRLIFWTQTDRKHVRKLYGTLATQWINSLGWSQQIPVGSWKQQHLVGLWVCRPEVGNPGVCRRVGSFQRLKGGPPASPSSWWVALLSLQWCRAPPLPPSSSPRPYSLCASVAPNLPLPFSLSLSLVAVWFELSLALAGQTLYPWSHTSSLFAFLVIL